MARAEIPKHVRQLILRHIDSVQQVEILTLLAREPERVWTPAELSRALHIAPEACARWLDEFSSAGLIEQRRDGMKHADAGPRAHSAEELVECYARRRIAVIDAIYNKPSSALQSFSDSFRVRRDD